ncbi:MAG: hypothetical protein K9G24_06040 [Candidatus Nanopelagicales bacterium]|nr:hypothetical protein [Candidatus Nanopelagicales bacterium]MCF8537285.1 hypothetical protein [Candidatus Nanopelagicales bacterium]MCF8542628.1 hypothetical protein [Candidatus Nanopelagicales bacterium]MCF8557716.1 hypothetical protein [Candidatus Nanopelagicales bacterium]
MSGLLDRRAVVELLTELGRRLDGRGQAAEIYVDGGTAMVLAYDRERLTRDIDAIWEETHDLDEVVAQMAVEFDLPDEWINDRVRPMLPRVLDAGASEALVVPGLTVSVASTRHMMAMKARAARDARDLDDLELLCRREGITSSAEVLRIADEVWGEGMLRPETVFAVREGLRDRGLEAD